MKILYSLLITFVVLSSVVCSIGITIPLKTFYFFTPDFELTQKYQVIGGSSGVPLHVELTGDLVNFSSMKGRTDFIFGVLEPKSFSIQLKLPESLPMGPHYLYITAKEDIADGSGLSATANVQTKLTIMVPYAGKVPVTKFSASAVKLGEMTKFTIQIQNLGDVGIDSAVADISIFDGSELVGSVKSSSSSVPSQDTTLLNAMWSSPDDISPGIYSATAKLVMDDIVHNLSTDLRLGEEDIIFVDYPVELVAGTIAEFPVDIKSIWNNPIKNIDLTLQLLGSGGGGMIHSVKSPVFDLVQWEEKQVDLYLNLPHTWVGSYSAKLILNFEGKETVEEFKLDVKVKSEPLTERETNINKGIFRISLLLFLLILVLVNLGVYRYLKNKQTQSI